MSNLEIENLQSRLSDSASIDETAAALCDVLRESKDYHRLFDALMIGHRARMGLPLARPSSLDNVPEEHAAEYRERFVETAREVGRLFLEDGRIADAWAYFRTINEPEPVREAIERIPIPREADDKFDELLNVALYEAAHPVRGLELLLRLHGTCNTVTAFDHVAQHMNDEQRRQASKLLVNQLYGDLSRVIRSEVEQKTPLLDAKAGLSDLIRGRDWLFEGGNYHIDVSHLHSTVRFARALKKEDPELQKAIELADYGSRLEGTLQYPGDAPFTDFYTASRHFLSALADQDTDAAFDYFRQQLASEPDEPDQRMIAYVMVDLAGRCDRDELAVELAVQHLRGMEDPNGFSFTEFCLNHHRPDALTAASQEIGDVVGWVTGRIAARSKS